MDKLGFLGHVRNLDFNLFGIDLSVEPKIAFNILVLIPMLCYVSQALSTFLSVRMNKTCSAGTSRRERHQYYDDFPDAADVGMVFCYFSGRSRFILDYFKHIDDRAGIGSSEILQP